jgi:glycogen phosphorylase/synthase
MTEEKMTQPDYLFEVSWEVCNKIGGIYTVVSTKALSLGANMGDNMIMIGPDIWKDTAENPYFTEDKYLYKSWKNQAAAKGLRFKIGRWNVAGKPVAILVDFTPYIANKDNVFSRFWEKYKLDSLSGQWDYIEPALFGYAAGLVIEDFYNFYNTSRDRIIAQFHEWMTGTGVLYLNDNVPQIGTVFTTHATVIGRCLAGNGLPLYSQMSGFKSGQKAMEFNVVAKHSLETTAALTADAFTTVSEVTAEECRHFIGRNPDVITPNGFEDSFVPDTEHFELHRKTAREAMLKVASALTNVSVPANALLVGTSGRYEFHNKGIDVFIDALGALNNAANLTRDVVAFLFIPANSYGPRKELLDRLESGVSGDAVTETYLTHRLHDKEYDPIIQQLCKNNLLNRPEDKVKVLFVPCYLNGHDGVFNLDYYDLLIGLDLTVFPSYYEPWGYTPLESLAFHVPTITTTLSGFGKWVESYYNKPQSGISVIPRGDFNDAEVAANIHTILIDYAELKTEDEKTIRNQAYLVSRIALWKNLVVQYEKAYLVALDKVALREELFINKRQVETPIAMQRLTDHSAPQWRRAVVRSQIPQTILGLRDIAQNLWWAWNFAAQDMFEHIDPKLWATAKHNPVELLESLSYEALIRLENDTVFVEKYNAVYAEFKQYMAAVEHKPKMAVAYFSMEYGLHDTIKIFSGGLGMLAGDYLKDASDCNANMVGVGLLYKYGYFSQQLTVSGEQQAYYEAQHFSRLPLTPMRDDTGEWILVKLAFPGRNVYARIWRVDVGRVPLYLLDTDFADNHENDRSITHKLYGGDWENRLKQELLLGVGGIRMLDLLGIKTDVFHINEGHAAFLTLERLRKLIQEQNFSFTEAYEIVRASTLFTTHTPVPAGHDAFSEEILRTYIAHYADRLNISWNEFMNLGRLQPNNTEEKYSMSHLAARLSSEVNGVSRIHGRVSRDMFNDLWPGFFAEELHIGHVTNGVHYPTWTSRRMRALYESTFDKDFINNQSNPEKWKPIHDVPDEVIWDIRQQQRKDLIQYLRTRTEQSLSSKQESPHHLMKLLSMFDEKALTIGFARRFATYKRAHLLFKDMERLTKLVNQADRPIQFIFAGKAHPNDKAGQELIRFIVEVTNRPEFRGNIFFIENYDMELGKMLTSGVDVWLNNPTRPLEASGTSGEKAVMNGVLNLSVLDGWWAEGYLPGAGWALKEERTYQNQDYQDELDSVTIYNILENEVMPLFYERDEKGIPHGWVKAMKKCIAEIAPRFTMKRQFEDYVKQYYTKLYQRTLEFRENDYAEVKAVAGWKRKVRRSWESIEVVDIVTPDTINKPLKMGECFRAQVTLDLNELSVNDVGAEIVFVESAPGKQKIDLLKEMEVINTDGKRVTYACEIPASRAGIYNFTLRVYPKNENLPHRQDFPLIHWI